MNKCTLRKYLYAKTHSYIIGLWLAVKLDKYDDKTSLAHDFYKAFIVRPFSMNLDMQDYTVSNTSIVEN